MQLIVEPEPNLDIEINMSTVDNIQNNKKEDNKIIDVDIDDLNDKKCNGNKDMSVVKQNSEGDVKKQIISEICESIANNVQMGIENNEAEISNVNLSQMINEKSNTFEIENLNPKESQKDITESNVNGIEAVENEIMNVDETNNTLEEDYLEDDIISIREEPLKEIPVAEVSIVSQKDEEIVTENNEQLAVAKDKLEILPDKSASLEQEMNTPIEDDTVKVIEETENIPSECTLHTESRTYVEKDIGDIIESGEQISQLQLDKENQLETKEDSVTPAVQNENITHPVPKEKGDIKVVHQSEMFVQCQKTAEVEHSTEDSDTIESREEVASSATCEKNIETPREITESKDDIAIIEEIKEAHSESHNKTSLPDVENKKQNPVETLQATQNDKYKVPITDKTPDRTNLCGEKADLSTHEKHEFEFMKETKEACVIDKNETESTQGAETNNPVKSTKNATSHEDNCSKTIETSKYEPIMELSNIDSITTDELKDDAMEVEEIVMEAKSTTEPTSSSIELKDDMDVEEVVPETESNKSDCKEVKDSTPVSTTPVNVIDNQLKDDMDVEEVVQETESNKSVGKEVKDSTPVSTTSVNVIDNQLKDDLDVEEVVQETESNKKYCKEVKDSTPVSTTPVNVIDNPIICKLSNTLNILSDDEEELLKEDLPNVESAKVESPKLDSSKTADENNKQCINIEDDDDIMLIDEDTNKTVTNTPVDNNRNQEIVTKTDVCTESEALENPKPEMNDLFESHQKKDSTPPPTEAVPVPDVNIEIDIKEKIPEPKIVKPDPPLPLIPDNFVKTAKKKLSDMTRDDLEEFCILKIVESIVDRSSLSDIKNKLKSLTQSLDEHRKKATMLTKQNRDLQVVLKSVQEEQKKAISGKTITPLKITRSVGMQVFMEKTIPKRKGQQQNNNNKNANNTQNKNTIPMGQGPRFQKQFNQSIPVPRLVPASNPTMKSPSTIPQINQINTPNKNINPPNGILKPPPLAVKAEKRPFTKLGSSVTVDLTDDEPPSKMPGGPRTSPAPPVRLVSPQNLMVPQRQPFGTNVNSPRKVYIPISGPQNQALRPGQTIMLKTVPASGMRQRCPTPQVTRVDPNQMRLSRIAPRHPAPLPFAMKQYQPPNWKSLPPAPDLKLSKVENGIVISWKIEGVPEDSYEEIASYQLYAYQETTQPPSTTLWKKIGDVKALPLPMACTLTQFMAGFKYYFAVRAVDIRSRLGPFSLPGSILLLSKNI